ncbi:hypothetical protein RI129_005237 [Pyrocoelia pectoralis]|uniref:Uncharacterized protein n=1 Tax=Pyrocoelia pectoralis TaxID=417401 RepID=A0AAN7VKD8_9COLE
MAIRGKENENGVYEFPYMVKPVYRNKCEAFKAFLWNPSTREALGRTGPSWAKILLFYVIFYICLAALFAICMTGLYATLNKERPKYTHYDSIIGSNPGLGFRPLGDDEGALIWYKLKDPKTSSYWVELLEDFLKDYRINSTGPDSKFSPDCNFQQPPVEGLACPVNTAEFGPCSPPFYGYDTVSPCVFLKLNKVLEWEPEYYNTTEGLPPDMPPNVIERITAAKARNESNYVWISCEGEYDADKEHLSGAEFQFYPPSGGFPSYYYPYNHKKNAYLSPLIAVRIMNPAGGVMINIECRAWARNIVYIGGSPHKRKGSVHFEIMRDDA